MNKLKYFSLFIIFIVAGCGRNVDTRSMKFSECLYKESSKDPIKIVNSDSQEELSVDYADCRLKYKEDIETIILLPQTDVLELTLQIKPETSEENSWNKLGDYYITIFAKSYVGENGDGPG